MHKKVMQCLVCILLTLALLSLPASAEVTIRIAHWLGDPGYGGTPIDNLMKAVQEKVAPYGIKVETILSQVNGYRDKVLTQVIGGVGPDVAMELPYEYALQRAGIFADLTPYLENDRELNLKSFIPSALEMYRYWGGIWLLPHGVSPYLFFYNPQYFREAGLGFPNKTWTWAQDVDAAARKLRVVDGNNNVSRWGLLLENRPWTLIFSNGGEIINKEGTKSLLTDPAVAGISELVQSWRKENIIPAPANHRPNFMAGKGAMHAVMGTFAWGAYAAQPFEWSFSHVPLGATGMRSIEENTIGWGIVKDTKNPEAAWIVAKALATVSGSITMEVLNHFSLIKSKTDNETIRYIQQTYGRSREEIEIALDSANYVRPSMRHERAADIISIALGAVRNVMFNGKASGPTFTDAADRINAILADSAK